ncbi:hypothetical protein [Cumulibacter soli]|uniref:hypothetical protein n=1 Tax=Cumulibacter soli TaxID=2546344 RepID=UPI001068B038|nr:hypothetical protein [Cumulibacter soli]
MGIRYYGWPLRTDLDFAAALNDPCSASRVIDQREAAHAPHNCVGLDKAHLMLYQYFTTATSIEPPLADPTMRFRESRPNEPDAKLRDVLDPEAFSECECVAAGMVTVMPRPGAILLTGDAVGRWSPSGVAPYFGVVRREYVNLAAADFLTVDLNELEHTCDVLFGDGHGSYCRSQFAEFRDAIVRFAAEDAGFLYSIT